MMTSRGLRTRVKPVHLLIIAAGLHVTITVLIYLVGWFQMLPGVFDTNGLGILFAADCTAYRGEVISLIDTLSQKGVVAWLLESSWVLTNPFHLKLYSLSFAALGPVLGYNILSAEPFNLTYYLLILYLVYALGCEMFDRRVGLLAAIIIGLWPSFFLHTVQLFRDPLFIAAMLALTLTCARWLTRDYSLRKGLAAAGIGAVEVLLLRVLRREMWEVVLVLTLLTIGFLLFKQIIEKRVRAGNLLGAALVLVVVIVLPHAWKPFEVSYLIPNPIAIEESTVETAARISDQAIAAVEVQRVKPRQALAARISWLRQNFVMTYPNSGSNIDQDVEFKTTADIILYLPRAAAIGFLAPFPNMWFVAGAQTGLGGRLLSGMETLLMYAIEMLAIFALWRRRRSWSAWLLVLVAGVGVIALSLVVTNIAALYRLRYVFWMLLIILGAEGLMQTYSMWVKREKLKLEELSSPVSSLT